MICHLMLWWQRQQPPGVGHLGWRHNGGLQACQCCPILWQAGSVKGTVPAAVHHLLRRWRAGSLPQHFVRVQLLNGPLPQQAFVRQLAHSSPQPER